MAMGRFDSPDKQKLLRLVHRAKPAYDRAVKFGKVWDDIGKFVRAIAFIATFAGAAWFWWTKPASGPADAAVKQELAQQKAATPLSKPDVEQKQTAPAEKKESVCITDSMATAFETLANTDKPRSAARRLYVGRDVCNWLVTVIGIREEDDGWRILAATPEGLRLVMFMRQRKPFALNDKVRIGGKVADFYSGPKDEPMLRLQAGWANPCPDCDPNRVD